MTEKEKVKHDMDVLINIKKSLRTLKTTSPNYLIGEVKEALGDLEIQYDKLHGNPESPDLSFLSVS
jgi:hypothetical protein